MLLLPRSRLTGKDPYVNFSEHHALASGNSVLSRVEVAHRVRHEYEYCDVCVIDQMTICSMTIFRFRNDSPVIPRPLHNSATEEIDTSAYRADQRSARHVRSQQQQCKMPSLERRKKHTKSQRLCNTKLDYTSRLMGVNICANLLCIVPKTPTETRKVRTDTKLQRCSGPFRCSRMFTRFQHCGSRHRRCHVKNCQPRETFVAPNRREK